MGGLLSLKQNALDKLLEYRRAHIAWKSAPDGPEKVEAKRVRGQVHSAMLSAAELYEKSLATPEHR